MADNKLNVAQLMKLGSKGQLHNSILKVNLGLILIRNAHLVHKHSLLRLGQKFKPIEFLHYRLA